MYTYIQHRLLYCTVQQIHFDFFFKLTISTDGGSSGADIIVLWTSITADPFSAGLPIIEAGDWGDLLLVDEDDLLGELWIGDRSVFLMLLLRIGLPGILISLLLSRGSESTSGSGLVGLIGFPSLIRFIMDSASLAN